MKLIDKISILLSTGLFSGYFPLFPGTFASFLTCIALYYILPVSTDEYFLYLLILFFVGVYTSTVAEKTLGHDAKKIVIDEIFGMSVAILYVPITLTNLIIAFILFRLFDIFKPFPINASQKLKQGWGVMVDDLIAGIYAMAILNAYILFFTK